MPRGDGTGPMGQGRGTGQGRGKMGGPLPQDRAEMVYVLNAEKKLLTLLGSHVIKENVLFVGH